MIDSKLLDLIADFKREGFDPVYAVEYKEQIFIYRELTLGEWDSLKNLNLSELCAAEHMAKLGILYPKYDQLLPGEIRKVGELIYQVSSKFANEDAMSAEIQAHKKQILHGISGLDTIIMTICDAFPAYKPEDILNFSYDTLVTRLAQAEAKFEPRKPFVGLNPERAGMSQFDVPELQQASIETSREALNQELNKHRGKKIGGVR